MLLAMEIFLTISAWRRGWGGAALLPLAGAFLLAMFLGAAAGPESSEGTILVLGLGLDIACIVVLGLMCAHAPHRAGETRPEAEAPAKTAASSVDLATNA